MLNLGRVPGLNGHIHQAIAKQESNANHLPYARAPASFPQPEKRHRYETRVQLSRLKDSASSTSASPPISYVENSHSLAHLTPRASKSNIM